MTEAPDKLLQSAIAGAVTDVFRRRAAVLRERAKGTDTSTAAHLNRLASDWVDVADEVAREFGTAAAPATAEGVQ